MNPANKRVRNPFEAALAESLHLPLIASPSLFQRPATPQLSSTQFEWTIDEVSSIKPANVEPHETQFQDSPDPEYEAKAQLAISSYFKDHQIVPSPVNCSVRQQRIILAEINGNTPIGKPGRRIRDFGTQTALSLPVDLPPELEEALRPYFQPQLATCYTEDGIAITNWHDGSGFSSSNSNSSVGHNVSMRRKLFDMHNIILWDENRKVPTPKKQQSTSIQLQQPLLPLPSIAGKLSDSLDKSSNDMILSPISGSDCLSASPHSPNNIQGVINSDGSQNCHSAIKQKRPNSNSKKKYVKVKIKRRRSALFNPPNAEELSPIYPAIRNNKQRRQSNENDSVSSQLKNFVTPAKVRKANFTRRRLDAASADEDDSNNAKFTPDRSSSPLHSFHSSASACSTNANTISTESFHIRISRLVVHSGKTPATNDEQRMSSIDTEISEIDNYNDHDEDEVMQISQISQQNSNNLSNNSINSHCDTPNRKRRSASRKNLSRSFSANWQLNDDDDNDGDDDRDDDDINRNDANDNDDNDMEIDKRNAYFGKTDEQPKKVVVNDKAIKELVTSVLKVPGITDFIAVTTISNNESGQLSSSEMQKIVPQQQNAHFYRTDSGFNEMTTSSSLTTNCGLSLISQQDELSREAFNFKSNEVSAIGDMNGKRASSPPLPCCSTPSQPRKDYCLPIIPDD